MSNHRMLKRCQSMDSIRSQLPIRGEMSQIIAPQGRYMPAHRNAVAVLPSSRTRLSAPSDRVDLSQLTLHEIPADAEHRVSTRARANRGAVVIDAAIYGGFKVSATTPTPIPKSSRASAASSSGMRVSNQSYAPTSVAFTRNRLRKQRPSRRCKPNFRVSGVAKLFRTINKPVQCQQPNKHIGKVIEIPKLQGGPVPRLLESSYHLASYQHPLRRYPLKFGLTVTSPEQAGVDGPYQTSLDEDCTEGEPLLNVTRAWKQCYQSAHKKNICLRKRFVERDILQTNEIQAAKTQQKAFAAAWNSILAVERKKVESLNLQVSELQAHIQELEKQQSAGSSVAAQISKLSPSTSSIFGLSSVHTRDTQSRRNSTDSEDLITFSESEEEAEADSTWSFAAAQHSGLTHPPSPQREAKSTVVSVDIPNKLSISPQVRQQSRDLPTIRIISATPPTASTQEEFEQRNDAFFRAFWGDSDDKSEVSDYTIGEYEELRSSQRGLFSFDDDDEDENEDDEEDKGALLLSYSSNPSPSPSPPPTPPPPPPMMKEHTYVPFRIHSPQVTKVAAGLRKPIEGAVMDEERKEIVMDLGMGGVWWDTVPDLGAGEFFGSWLPQTPLLMV